MKEGWEIKKIKDCFKLKSGDALTSKMMNKEGVYPVFGGNGVAGFHNNYNLSGNNVIIGRVGALCGNVRNITEKIWLTDNAFRIVEFRYEFDNSFLTYLLNFKNLREYAKQTAQPVISNSSLEDVILEFPKSLNEQRCIVEILDKTFGAIEKAKSYVEKNLQNANDLFENYLNEVFTNTIGTWTRKSFIEICVLQRGFDLPTHSRIAGPFPLVSSNGITDKIDKWKVKSPGVVTGRSGTIGNVHYIESEFWPLNTALYVKDFHGNHEKFVYFFLKHFKLERYSTGAGVPTLNRNNVHDEIISFPTSIEEQRRLANSLDVLSNKLKNIESFYQNKIYLLEKLKGSILQKALAGELTHTSELTTV